MKKILFIHFGLCLLLLTNVTNAQDSGFSQLASEIDSLVTMIQKAFDQKDPETAHSIIDLTEARARIAFGEQSYEYAEAVFQRGRALRFQGKNQEAEEKYLLSLDIYRKSIGEYHPAFAKNLFNLAALQMATGRIDESEVNMIRSMDIRKAAFGPSHLSLVDNLNWLTDLNLRKGLYNRALSFADSALNILTPQVPESDPAFTKSLYWRSVILMNLGNYEEAETALLKLLDIGLRVHGMDHPETASVRNNLGLLYWRLGRLADAEEQWLETIRIREKSLGSNHPLTIRSYGNMGIFYFQTGNMKKTEIFFIRNLQGLAETTGKLSQDYAQALNNLSSYYQEMGDLAKAEPLVREGLEILESSLGREHPQFAISLYNLAILQEHLGHWDAARATLLETEVIRRKVLGNHHYDLGLTLLSLARLERSMGQLEMAQEDIQEALVIFYQSVGEAHPDYIAALLEKALQEEETGEIDAAVKSYWDIARLDREAIQQALFFLSDTEILDYLYRFQNHQDHMMKFAAQSAHPEMTGLAYDQTLFLKGFLLYARQKMRNKAMTDPSSREIYFRLKEDYGQLAQEMAKTRADRDSILVAKLTEQTNQSEKELARSVGELGMELRPVSWQDVQVSLQPGELAIEFVSHAPYPYAPKDSTIYSALLVSPGKEAPLMVPLFREGQLGSLLSVKTDRRSDYVNDLYAYADRGLVVKADKQASLEQLIWEPLMKYIKNENTLFIAPGGVLHRINLGAIPTSPDRVLADDFRMVFLGSTRHLVTDPKNLDKTVPSEAMIFGGIRFDPDSTTLAKSIEKSASASDKPKQNKLDSLRGSTWSYLSWTAREAKTIAEILSEQGVATHSYLDSNASEETFKELATGFNTRRILHLATHGFFYPDPTSSTTDSTDVRPAFKASDDPMIRSGLVLANGNFAWQYGRPLVSGMEDGILTALEISQLDLSNVQLVVLSACETGLGDIQGNEGVYGLQRAFKIAGAKYLIMSLWQVPDRETMQFMTTFYRNWLEEQLTIPEAFRKTQLEMRDRFFNPYAWAGFVLLE